MDKTAAGVFVFCAAVISVSEMPAKADAFLEPFASQLIAKKMMLKHGLVPVVPHRPVQYYAEQPYQHQPRPAPPPPPSPTYPPYGPPSQSGYGQPAYSPPIQPAYSPPSQPEYNHPPSYSGYEPAPLAVKPSQPQPGCLPAGNPGPQVDYSQYTVHGGHGYGSYGNSGGYGK